MTQREKVLLALVGLIVLLWGANLLRGRYVAWYERAEAAQREADEDLRRAELELLRAKYAQRKLRDWQEKSLPADPERAQGQYRDWLIATLKGADLGFEFVKPTASLNRWQVSAQQVDPLALSFSIQTAGKMEDVLKFLYEFYEKDQLHKITKLSLTPARGRSDDVTAIIGVEALVVPGTKRDALAEGVSDRLVHSSAKEYIDRITSRSLFAEYKPPRPEPRPRVVREERPRPAPPKFDDSERAYFNAAVQGLEHGKLRAWVNVRTTGESLQLSVGDTFEIGRLKGEVASVSLKELVIDTEEGTLAVKLGDSLRSGKKIDGSRGDAGG